MKPSMPGAVSSGLQAGGKDPGLEETCYPNFLHQRSVCRPATSYDATLDQPDRLQGFNPVLLVFAQPTSMYDS